MFYHNHIAAREKGKILENPTVKEHECEPTPFFLGCRKTFEKLFLEALDEGLSRLGESDKQAIYFHIEKRFGIKKGEMSFRVDDFADALEKIFGPGAKLIEIQIMKNLHKKIGAPLKWDKRQQNIVFTEYVDVARRSFEWKKQAKLEAKQRHTRKL
jgi:hypothetical protein